MYTSFYTYTDTNSESHECGRYRNVLHPLGKEDVSSYSHQSSLNKQLIMQQYKKHHLKPVD